MADAALLTMESAISILLEVHLPWKLRELSFCGRDQQNTIIVPPIITTEKNLYYTQYNVFKFALFLSIQSYFPKIHNLLPLSKDISAAVYSIDLKFSEMLPLSTH